MEHKKIETVGSKFSRLIGGSVLGHADRKNVGPWPVHLEIESPIEQYFIRERRAYMQRINDVLVFTRKSNVRIIYPTIDGDRGRSVIPLPRIRDLNISGALPYFLLVVGFLLSVGGWFWWFFRGMIGGN